MKVLTNLKHVKSYSTLHVFDEFPAIPQAGMLVMRDDGILYIYSEVEGTTTWRPLNVKTKTYVHTQGSASLTWNITHNLGTQNLIFFIYDTDNYRQIEAGVSFPTEDTMEVTFSEAIAGKIVIFAEGDSYAANTQNPIDLIHDKVYTNESVSLSLNISDCDNIVIDYQGVTNTAAFVTCTFGTDTTVTNYMRQYLQGSGSSASAGSDSTTLPSVSGNNGFSVTCGTMTVMRSSKALISTRFSRNGGLLATGMHSFIYTGAQSTNTLTISGSGFTGQLKVYKKY